MTIRPTTRLSDLQALARTAAQVPTNPNAVPERMLRSVEQSMRVEGYTMSREHVIAAARDALSTVKLAK